MGESLHPLEVRESILVNAVFEVGDMYVSSIRRANASVSVPSWNGLRPFQRPWFYRIARSGRKEPKLETYNINGLTRLTLHAIRDKKRQRLRRRQRRLPSWQRQSCEHPPRLLG